MKIFDLEGIRKGVVLVYEDSMKRSYQNLKEKLESDNNNNVTLKNDIQTIRGIRKFTLGDYKTKFQNSLKPKLKTIFNELMASVTSPKSLTPTKLKRNRDLGKTANNLRNFTLRNHPSPRFGPLPRKINIMQSPTKSAFKTSVSGTR